MSASSVDTRYERRSDRAQETLDVRLWQLGLVERALLPPAHGGAPVAYRVSLRGRERLGYPARQREGVTHLRHTLDCATMASGWTSPPSTSRLIDSVSQSATGSAAGWSRS